MEIGVVELMRDLWVLVMTRRNSFGKNKAERLDIVKKMANLLCSVIGCGSACNRLFSAMTYKDLEKNFG